MDKVGKKIKTIRELRDYSRMYLAIELGLSLNSYGKIERDEVDITLKRLVDIAEILDVSITEILNFDSNKLLNKSSKELI